MSEHEQKRVEILTRVAAAASGAKVVAEDEIGGLDQANTWTLMAFADELASAVLDLRSLEREREGQP